MNPYELGIFNQEPEIIVTYIHWPILGHNFDYCASLGAFPRGYGATEEEAIANLVAYDWLIAK